MRAYISGPMRGYPQYNFPAFDKARDELIAMGHKVVSPADMDRAIGFDGYQDWTEDHLRDAVRRDVNAILDCDVIVVLPGWTRSTGARSEVMVGVFAQMPVYDFESMQLLDISVLGGDEWFEVTAFHQTILLPSVEPTNDSAGVSA